MDSFDIEESKPWYSKEKLPSNWTRLDLQPRDLKLLRILLEQKFLTREQIEKFIFKGKKRYAYLRLWKLRRFDFIKRVTGFHPSGLYLATKKTYDYFKSQFVEVPAPLIHPDPRSIQHDLVLTNVRFLFEQIGFGSFWTSERTWRMGRSIRLWSPDAVLQVGGDSFAVEVERIQKDNDRYESIFARYQGDDEISACLYITTESLLDVLMERAETYPTIYFVTLADLFKKKEKAVFRNAQGNFLEIEENLEKNLEFVSETEREGS